MDACDASISIEFLLSQWRPSGISQCAFSRPIWYNYAPAYGLATFAIGDVFDTYLLIVYGAYVTTVLQLERNIVKMQGPREVYCSGSKKLLTFLSGYSEVLLMKLVFIIINIVK